MLKVSIFFLISVLCQRSHGDHHLSIDDFLNSGAHLFPNQTVHHQHDDEAKTLERFKAILEDPDVLDKAYMHYQIKYGERENTFGLVPTLNMRKELFKDNLAYIFHHNLGTRMKNLAAFEMGVNIFADIAIEEFKMERLGFDIEQSLHLDPPQPPHPNVEFKPEGREIPSSFDWREKGVISSVKDQQKCGSCVMFAITSAMEAMYAINTFNKPILDLSEQFPLDCATADNGYKKNKGCSGNVFPDSLQFGVDHGFTTEDDYPYKGKQGTCTFEIPRITYLKNFTKLPDSREDVQYAIHANGPCAFGIWVYRPMMFYSKGIYDACVGMPIGGHAMAKVGFNNEGSIRYYNIKNQWGSDWGEEGYMRYISTDPKCGLHKMVYSFNV